MKSITIEDNEKYLRQISKPVEKNDSELINDIEVLKKYCLTNEVMAMAAVQLGIPKRLVYLKNTNLELINKIQNSTVTEEEKKYNEARILINPIVLGKEGLTEYWEACASCLDNMGRVKRPYKILVEYEDELRRKKQEFFEGFEATVLSHELDHLDGILHMDIAEEVLKMPVEERKIFRQTHKYQIFFKEGVFEELKNGRGR